MRKEHEPKKLELFFTPKDEINIKQLVDIHLPQEIEDFQKWFRKKAPNGLTPMEKEILKAYLFYKIFEDKNARDRQDIKNDARPSS